MNQGKRRDAPGGVSAEQLGRVRYFESLLEEVRQLLSDPEASAEKLLAAAGKVGELEEYYGSPEWKRDYSDEEAGLFPADLRRGVLSEDGIYNTLEEYRERIEDCDNLDRMERMRMKTVIVYYSLEGNTDYAAKRIAAGIGADLLRLVPEKDYPSSGFRKFFRGGKSAVMAETPKLLPYAFDAAAYDRVIFGFPVWASNVTPPIRTFIKENDLKGKCIAAFACEGGSGAEKAFLKLKAALGIEALERELVLIDPKTRPSEENERKIGDFCAAFTEAL